MVIISCCNAYIFIVQEPSVRKPPKERLMPATAGESSQSQTSLNDMSDVSAVDHTYVVSESPRSVKRKMDSIIKQAESVKKKLKYSNAKVRRLKQKVKSLADVVSNLKDKNMISANCEAMLNNTFSGVPLEIMKRLVNHKSSRPSRESYPEELKSFALTLSFYSAKAYNYVRKTFQLALPHPSTIRSWYSCMNCKPGFTQEAFDALKIRSEEAKRDSITLLHALLIVIAQYVFIIWLSRRQLPLLV